MTVSFKKATKGQAKLRLGLIGPPGAGKTWTALSIAEGIGGKVALLDTENSSASKYADRFNFDTVSLGDFAPRNYVEVIRSASLSGYSCLIIDSLSHAWSGRGGALEMADNAARKSKSGNSYTAWRDVTPAHNELVDAIVQSPIHIIATLRTKVEYVLETVNGKQVPKKVGLAPITGKGLEYEFDIVLDLDDGGKAVATKTRYHKLTGRTLHQPGPEFGAELAAWLSDGVPAGAVEVEAGLSVAIAAAADLATLRTVGKTIKESSLDGAHKEALRTQYRAREHELSSVTA